MGARTDAEEVQNDQFHDDYVDEDNSDNGWDDGAGKRPSSLKGLRTLWVPELTQRMKSFPMTMTGMMMARIM